jgi:hypothetical protein
MKSNLSVNSNLMIDDYEHREMYKFIPGDLISKIYPEYADPANRHNFLRKEQIVEMMQYLECQICHKPCAGNCKGKRNV